MRSPREPEHRPFRVLMVSQHRYASHQTTPPFPGHCTLTRNLDELLAHGAEIDLVAITPHPCRAYRPAGRSGLRVFGMRMEPRRSPAFWYPLQYAFFLFWALLMVSALALRRRYDVVQVDTIPDLLVFSTIVPKLRRMPIVLYIYDLMPEMTAARLNVAPDDWRVRLVASVERAATGWADRVITVTDLFRRILASRGLDPAKVALVANSHPIGDIPPRVRPKSPVLICQSTFIERYGVQVAIEAMALLRADWPSLTLELIGDGEYKPALLALTRKLGLERHVVFSPGFIPWPRAMAQVRRATLGIVPIVTDGVGELILPNKVFEFVLLEVPFVCSRLSGIAEHLPADAVAYFQPGDAAGLAAQVHRLLTHPDQARQQVARATEAMADLSWEQASRRYLAALNFPSESSRTARQFLPPPLAGEG